MDLWLLVVVLIVLVQMVVCDEFDFLCFFTW